MMNSDELRQLTERLVSSKVELSELWSIYNKGFLYQLF